MEHAQSHHVREVAIPAFLVPDLTRLVAGKQPDDLVFGGIRNGAPLRVSTFRTSFTAAARVIGVPDLHPHELRHTAASLAIASGADVKVVQKMLGHASATMTLGTYGHLFQDRLDEVADAMSRARDAEQQRASNGTPASPRRPTLEILRPIRVQTAWRAPGRTKAKALRSAFLQAGGLSA